MSITEIISTLTELQELKRMQEELSAEIETLQDKVKAHMGTDELLLAGPYKVLYQTVTTTRLDSIALKRDLPDIAARYTKSTTTRRFTVK